MAEKPEARRSSDESHGRARYDNFDHIKDYSGEERRASGELMRRIDKQDEMLLQIRDMVITHIEIEKTTRQSIDDLVLLWRGSKIIIPALTAVIGIIATAYLWAKDHIK